MNSTFWNLARKIASDLNTVQLSFAMLLGYVEGHEGATVPPMGSTNGEELQHKEDEKQENSGFLEFSDKEISDMPKILNEKVYLSRAELKRLPPLFRKDFVLQGSCAPFRKRTDFRYDCSYEIRYRKQGWSVSGSGATIRDATEKFIQNAIKAAAAVAATYEKKKKTATVPGTFKEFLTYYFENFRIRKVSKLTYNNDWYRCKNHLIPYFKSMPLVDITSDMVQRFCDERVETGSLKTAKELNSILSGMFNFAIEKKLLDRNPCKLVILEAYESEHGEALSFEEEDRLIASLKDNPKYLIPIAVALYTGLRPCEYRTATIEGAFIKARNLKQKTKKPIYKYIPIIPRLRAILGDTEELYFPDKGYLSEKLKVVCPNHKLYDLRTTFNSRCEYFKVADFARKTWMGHGLEKLRKTYGSLPPEWFLEESDKLDY